jgi:Uma2 family endonuclease
MATRGKIRFKATDIFDAPDDNLRYEVIDGDLYMTPAPSWWHQTGLGKLFILVGAWVYEHNLGWVASAPVGVVLDDEDGVQPDMVYVSRDRAQIISQRGLEGAPDLVVEALSPSTEARDRGIKMRRYAAAGVPHYWLLNPQTKSLEPFVLGAGGYEPAGIFGPGTTLRPAVFPGLEIAIDSLREL